MMQRIVTIAILFIAFGAAAQKVRISYDHREVVINYPDSTVKAVIYMKESKYKPDINAVYYWYQSNRIKKNLGGYNGKLLDGKYLVFDMNNNLITEGCFEKGIKSGTWKKWMPKGGLIRYEEWENGTKHGSCIAYSTEGKILYSKSYRKGLPDGEYKEYSGDSLIIDKMYREGIEVVPEPVTESGAQDELKEKRKLERLQLKEEKLKEREKEKQEKEASEISNDPDEDNNANDPANKKQKKKTSETQ